MNNQPPDGQPLPPEVGLTIRCEPHRITRSLETVQAVSADGTTPTDHGGRIGVRPDGTVEGCMVLRPIVTFSRKNPAEIL